MIYRTTFILIIASILSHIKSNGQTPLGIGLVSIKFNPKTVLYFYDNPNGKEPIKTIEFDNGWNIKNLDKQKEWLKPESIWLDYSSFVFRCKSIRGNWCEVIVNNETGKSFWLEKDSSVIFSDWETFLKGMFAIDRLKESMQKIRESPSDSSKEIPYDCKDDCFEVSSIKKDWIEIFSTDNCGNGDNTKCGGIKSGWIKWRNGDKLLIEYFITD